MTRELRNPCTLLVMMNLTTGISNHAQAKDGPTMDLSTSLRFVEQAEREASKVNVHVAVAVVDAGGNLVAFQRMDGTQLGSIELALRKAKTALYFVRPTVDLERALNGGNHMIATLPNALPAGGGYPIQIGGRIIGALGLSGGEGDTDARLAEAAVTAALKDKNP